MARGERGGAGRAGAGAGPVAADHGPRLDTGSSEALLRRLELVVSRRLDGLLQGNYLGLVPGPGSEAGESRPYVPGDDVRRMDWAVTARTTEAHLRETVADRELETWLVVDLSASLDFGTARSEKRELALAAATAVVHLTARTGNRVGAVVTTGETLVRIPAATGRTHARYLLRRLADTPRAATPPGPGARAALRERRVSRRGAAPVVPAPGDRTGGADGADLAAALRSLGRPPRRRGLIAVVSDFLAPGSGEPAWQRPLRALGSRHQLLAVEVLDPRELALAPAGLVTFRDPESGREVEVQTSDPALRERYARAAATQRADIALALRRAGAAHLQLRTDRDWVSDVVRFVVSTRRTGATAGPARTTAPPPPTPVRPVPPVPAPAGSRESASW